MCAPTFGCNHLTTAAVNSIMNSRHLLTPRKAASLYWPIRDGHCHRRCRFKANQALDQRAAPLLDAVLARGNQLQETPLHVPGHKRGRAVDPGMQQLLQAAGAPGIHGQPPATRDAAAAVCADSPLRCDLTELAGLDYLSSPSSVIMDAQDLAAAAFKCQQTWFLVNGCSVAVHAAVMAAVKPGQALLLARNCHLSAFSACVLSDAVPVWLQPEQDSLHDIAHCITPEQLQHGFDVAKAHGLDVGAVLVVSPTYYGAVARVSELAEICHQHGVPLLVDEAHGGHLSPLARDLQDRHTAAQDTPAAAAAASTDCSTAPHAQHEDVQVACTPKPNSSTKVSAVPLSAVDAGADVVMHSTHKVLTAMTQAAMLHLCSARVAPSKISKALQVLQTSSPSYILLASLDAARRHAFTPGVWSEPLAAAEAARDQLAQLPGLSLLQDGSCGCQKSVLGFDPCRLVLNVSSLDVSGFAAAAWLEKQHGIVPELATNKLVVFVFGPGSTQADASRLADACMQLCSAHTCMPATQPLQETKAPASPTPKQTPARSSEGTAAVQAAASSAAEQPLRELEQHQVVAPVAALSPRQAFFADSEAVSLQDAVGRVSAELLCPYPPGVPVVFPGECFTAANVQQLQETLAGGGVVTGGQDSTLQTVLVVVESS